MHIYIYIHIHKHIYIYICIYIPCGMYIPYIYVCGLSPSTGMYGRNVLLGPSAVLSTIPGKHSIRCVE